MNPVIEELKAELSGRGDEVRRQSQERFFKEEICCARHEDEVYDFVVGRRDVMPRTALRYAIETMPKERKREAMRK